MCSGVQYSTDKVKLGKILFMSTRQSMDFGIPCVGANQLTAGQAGRVALQS